MSKELRYTKRPTRKLQEVIDSDLLTATERLVCNDLGGFYKMAEEQAYFRKSGEKASVSISEFERMIRKLHPNFFVLYNPTKCQPHKVEGHQIGFFVPEYNGFVPLCRVGLSGQKQIQANSQGKVVKQKRDQRGEDEVAVVWRGYLAAHEACRAFINDVQVDGIKPSRCIDPRDFLVYKKTAQEVNGQAALHKAFEEGRRIAEAAVLAEQERATQGVEKFLEKVVEETKNSNKETKEA